MTFFAMLPRKVRGFFAHVPVAPAPAKSGPPLS